MWELRAGCVCERVSGGLGQCGGVREGLGFGSSGMGESLFPDRVSRTCPLF